MIARPFGLMGNRYELNALGKKCYIASWVISALFIISLMFFGVMYIRGEVIPHWSIVVFVPMITILTIIRLIAVTVENGKVLD